MAKEIRVALVLDDSSFKRGIRSATTELGKFENAADGAAKRGGALKSQLGDIFTGVVAAGAVTQIISYSDQITGLQNKLNAFSGSQEEANARLDTIRGIADRARGSITGVGDLYVKIGNNAKQMGVSQAEVGKITETFAKSLKVGGATAGEAASATLQFAQAMGSGVLRGEEFNAVYEASPDTMNKLAAALGIPIEDMRKLAEEGALTSKVVAEGFLRMGADVEGQFAKTTPTIGESFQSVANNLMLLLNNVEKSTGIFSGFAAIVKFAAENIVLLGAGAAIAFGPQLIGAISKATTAMRAFSLSNPFTAIALAITVVIAYIASLAEKTGGLGNAFKTMGNSAIGVINGLYNGFSAFFSFMGGALGALGKAFMVAINPFSKESAKTVLMQGISGAMSNARKAFNSAGPITFRFKLEPVKKAGAADAYTPDTSIGTPTLKGPKEKKTAVDREAERNKREREKEIDDARDLILEIENQTAAIRRKLDIELESVGLSDRQRGLAEQLRDIDEKRREDITDIQKLQRLTADEQATKIAQINASYAAQTAEIKAGNEALYRRKSITEDILNINNSRRDIIRNYDLEISSIEAIAAARKNGNDQDVKNAEERERILRKFADQRFALTKQIDASTDKVEIERLESQRTNILFLERTELNSLGKLQTKREEILEQQKEFGFGLSEAMKRFGETVNDQAAYGQRIFESMSQGFTDSILKFVETGKLSFKDLFKSLMSEIIKMQANKLFLNLFGDGTAKGGGVFGAILGSIFGKRAVGGPVMAGTPYIVGERGPELFVPSGPGTVQANGKFGGGGVTQIVYNINAVDALSFKQLVARDPEFIYSVSQAGARRLPR